MIYTANTQKVDICEKNSRTIAPLENHNSVYTLGCMNMLSLVYSHHPALPPIRI